MKKFIILFLLTCCANTLFAEDDPYSGQLELNWATYMGLDFISTSGGYYNVFSNWYANGAFGQETIKNNSKGDLFFCTSTNHDSLNHKETFKHHIWKFDADREFLWKKNTYNIPTKNAHLEQLICIDSSDNIYVLTYYGLEKYNDDGELVYSISSEEICNRSSGILTYSPTEGCIDGANPESFEADKDGNLYLYTSYLVLKFDTEGNLLWVHNHNIERFWYFGKSIMTIGKKDNPIYFVSSGNKIVFLDKKTGLVQKELNLNNIPAFANAISGLDVESIEIRRLSRDYNYDLVMIFRIFTLSSDTSNILLKCDTDGNSCWSTLLNSKIDDYFCEFVFDKHNNIYCFCHNYYLGERIHFDDYNIEMYKYSSSGKLLRTSLECPH